VTEKRPQSVSIALCSYNGERFIGEQIESFIQQTRLPDELVIGDDGSTDSTLEIIARLSVNAPFPVHLHQNPVNLGTTLNFEKTIEFCSGEVIFISDQDDVWKPEKIAEVVSVFSRSEDIGLVFTNAELFDENDLPVGKTLWDRLFDRKRQQRFRHKGPLSVLAMGKNVVTGAGMAIRRDLVPVLIANPAPRSVMHDEWWALVAALVSRIEYLDLVLFKYRQHSSQQIGASWSVKRKNRPYDCRMEHYQERIDQLQTKKRMLDRLIRITIPYNASTRIRQCYETSKHRSNRYLTERSQIFDEQIAHFQRRASMPPNLVKRVPILTREVLAGRYWLYSKGGVSILRDLFFVRKF